jgi:hypothetical protein
MNTDITVIDQCPHTTIARVDDMHMGLEYGYGFQCKNCGKKIVVPRLQVALAPNTHAAQEMVKAIVEQEFRKL